MKNKNNIIVIDGRELDLRHLHTQTNYAKRTNRTVPNVNTSMLRGTLEKVVIDGHNFIYDKKHDNSK